MDLRYIRDRELVEYVAKHESRDRKRRRQRRSTPHDIPGYEYQVAGDEVTPGILILRFSKDIQYIYDWSFKLIVEFSNLQISSATEPVPLTTNNAGGENIDVDLNVTLDGQSINTSSETVTINQGNASISSTAVVVNNAEDLTTEDEELDTDNDGVLDLDPHSHDIEDHTHTTEPHSHIDTGHSHTSNAHDHTVNLGGASGSANGQVQTSNHSHNIAAHSHGIVAGNTNIAPDIGELRIEIEGYDLTDQLNAQYPLPGIGANPTTIYPSRDIEENWDILKAAQDHSMQNGSNALTDIIATGEDKLIRVYNLNAPGSGQFTIRWQSYSQYSHTSR